MKERETTGSLGHGREGMSAPSEEAVLLSAFENLTADNFQITSARDRKYNCIAWAAEESNVNWWPLPELLNGSPVGGVYWPEGVGLDVTLPNFIRAFRRIGYRECDHGELEDGFEKIVLFVDASGIPTHAARQLQDGKWTSKLGKLNDISHDTAECAGGTEYGQPHQYMRRSVRERPPATLPWGVAAP